MDKKNKPARKNKEIEPIPTIFPLPIPPEIVPKPEEEPPVSIPEIKPISEPEVKPEKYL